MYRLESISSRNGETSINKKNHESRRVNPESYIIHVYIYNIHPELRIRDYRSRSGKGAWPL